MAIHTSSPSKKLWIFRSVNNNAAKSISLKIVRKRIDCDDDNDDDGWNMDEWFICEYDSWLTVISKWWRPPCWGWRWWLWWWRCRQWCARSHLVPYIMYLFVFDRRSDISNLRELSCVCFFSSFVGVVLLVCVRLVLLESSGGTGIGTKRRPTKMVAKAKTVWKKCDVQFLWNNSRQQLQYEKNCLLAPPFT